MSGCAGVLLCLRLCLRRYSGGSAGWRPGRGRSLSQGGTLSWGLSDGSIPIALCLLLTGICCLKWPFSMARMDWRLYSSLAQRALLIISSSAALERCTGGDSYVLKDFIVLNNRGRKGERAIQAGA